MTASPNKKIETVSVKHKILQIKGWMIFSIWAKPKTVLEIILNILNYLISYFLILKRGSIW